MMKRVDLIKTGGFTPTEHLVVSTISKPEVDQDEVLIDIKASAINPVDWKMAEFGFLLPQELPAAIGCDVAGTVVSKGSMEGKRVVTYLGANKAPNPTNRGAFGDYVVQKSSLVQEIPDDVSFAQAASLPVPAFTAEMLLNELSLQKGDWVLVWGASSAVGYNAVQLATQRGWKPIAVASGKHEAKLQSVGVAAFVDYTQPNLETNVKEILNGAPLKGAADCIGSPDTFGTCCKLIQESGSGSGVVSTVSPMGLPDPPEGIEKRAVDFGTILENEEGRAFVQKYFPEVVQLQALPIKSVKGAVTAETVQEAFALSKKGVSGEKVVIEWTE